MKIEVPRKLTKDDFWQARAFGIVIGYLTDPDPGPSTAGTKSHESDKLALHLNELMIEFVQADDEKMKVMLGNATEYEKGALTFAYKIGLSRLMEINQLCKKLVGKE